MFSLIQWVGVALVILAIWHFWDAEAFSRWKSEAGPVPFFLALAILPAMGFPVTPFYLVAGAVFDLPTALAGSLLALGGNLTLSYFLARYPLRSWLEKWLARSGRRLPQPEPRAYWRFAVLVKLLPGLPLFLKHSAIALAGVPFSIYFVASFAVSSVYAAAFIILGESALDRDYSQGGAALLVLAAITTAVFLIHRRGKRANHRNQGR